MPWCLTRIGKGEKKRRVKLSFNYPLSVFRVSSTFFFLFFFFCCFLSPPQLPDTKNTNFESAANGFFHLTYRKPLSAHPPLGATFFFVCFAKKFFSKFLRRNIKLIALEAHRMPPRSVSTLVSGSLIHSAQIKNFLTINRGKRVVSGGARSGSNYAVNEGWVADT